MYDLMNSTVIPGGLVLSCVRSKDINARKMKGKGTVVWLVCMGIEVVFKASCGKKLRVVEPKEIRSVVAVMDSYESLGSSMPTLVDYDVREDVEKLKGTVEVIDLKGA